MAKSKSKRKLVKKICNRCGFENSLSIGECKSCSCGKFAPSWVKAKRPVNRQVAVEITSSSPQYGDPADRITLSKWWPGGSASFHIPNPEQWSKIEKIVNEDLGPFLGWETKRILIKKVREKKESKKRADNEINKLAKDYPDILKQIITSIDLAKLGKENINDLVDIMIKLSDVISDADAGFRHSFLAVVKKLPEQPKKALVELEDLLSSWSLRQIASVAQQVKSRLETIELFKERIQDERTYEIIGEKSIHRILEKSMWLVDERYWLLQSNQSLLKFIGEEMSKKDNRRFGKKRPDFVCGTVGDKLIIIEIKRPKHVLEIDDLNQLETYLTIAEQYKTFRSYEAYLIGNKSTMI